MQAWVSPETFNSQLHHHVYAICTCKSVSKSPYDIAIIPYVYSKTDWYHLYLLQKIKNKTSNWASGDSHQGHPLSIENSKLHICEGFMLSSTSAPALS